MKHPAHRKKQQKEVDHFMPGKHQFAVYMQRCWSVITDAVVLLTVTMVGYLVVLYICKVLWHLYIATQTGQMFIAYFPEEAESTSRFLQMNLLLLSVWITIYAFIISLATGAICRLLHVARYIHEQFGPVKKTLICGLPLAALAAFYIQPLYGFPAWDTTFTIVLLPTLIVANRSFEYALKLLPELGDVKRYIKTANSL